MYMYILSFLLQHTHTHTHTRKTTTTKQQNQWYLTKYFTFIMGQNRFEFDSVWCNAVQGKQKTEPSTWGLYNKFTGMNFVSW